MPPKKLRATPVLLYEAAVSTRSQVPELSRSEPPEMMPMANPPTVTHETMIHPTNSGAGRLQVVATQRTPYVKKKRKTPPMISAEHSKRT